MKPRAMFTAVVLLTMLALPQLAGAVKVHTFDCKNCHISSLSVTQLGSGNVCLTCHDGSTPSMGLNDGRTGTLVSGFAPMDASNSQGSNPYVVNGLGQTSHNWGATDNQPAAGAEAPNYSTYPGMYSRQGSSTGRVACSRCHDPHADTTNPNLLRLGAGMADTMCVACHPTWNAAGSGMTHVSHPVNINYAAAAAANPGEYKAAPPEDDKDPNTNTPISLTSGLITCSSCHQTHFVDSDPATPDIPSNWENLSAAGGDGKMLRTYGRVSGDATKSSTLCQTCHNYTAPHSGTHTSLGCLDCHGGHSPAGNYYMLKPSVSGLPWVPKDGAPGSSDALSYTTATADWMNAGGTGYCQGCHTIPVDGTGKHNGLTVGDTTECGSCHGHDTGMAGGCTSCHGYAPASNTPGGASGGYAVDGPRNYSTSGVFKDETLTPHASHANGDGANGNYRYACKECHYQVVSVTTAPHNTGTFQNVTFNGGGTIAYTDAATPTYTPTGNGSCATTYCHSNGGPRSLGAIKYMATAPVWNGGIGDITTCNVCHGNDATTMADAQRDASTTHIVHLNKGYGCNLCHDNTAATNSSLKLSSIGAEHVNGTADVYFNNLFDLGGGPLGAGSYGTDGTCNVYCHGNGTVKVSTDWDVAGSGACGTCHQYSNAGVATGTGPALAGAHNTHVFDANGPQLACTICHTNNGAGTDHVNGGKTMVADYINAVCSGCHGSAPPAWTANLTNGNCSVCHGMSDPAVTGRDTNGDTANTDPEVGAHIAHLTSPLNYSADVACAACHSTTVANITAAGTYKAKVTAVGHYDTALPAELTFSGMASNNGATPSYDGAACSNTYCHDAAFIGSGQSNGQAGTIPHPTWADAAMFNGTVSDCDNCHGYPPSPANGHPNDNDCSSCHLNVVAADNAFTDPSKHVNGTVEIDGGDNCIDCHGTGKYKNPNINYPKHAQHTNVDAYLAGKKLSTNDYGRTETTWYDVSYDATNKPYIACGQCHPADVLQHKDGGVDVVMYHANPALDNIPAVNAKRNNLVSAQYDKITTGTCLGVYCHSDGILDGSYAASPSWSSGTITNCAGCHGNSPTTNSHADHAVGIHSTDLYDDDGVGLMAQAATGGLHAAHGGVATSTTLSCNICHNTTIDVAYNATGSACSSCHTVGDGKAGSLAAVIKANSTTHLDGAKTVAFSTLANFRSVAQVRSDYTAIAELNNAWSRPTGYKQASGASYDLGKRLPVWDGGPKTCATVDCHNGNAATWTDNSVSCSYCHTDLP